MQYSKLLLPGEDVHLLSDIEKKVMEQLLLQFIKEIYRQSNPNIQDAAKKINIRLTDLVILFYKHTGIRLSQYIKTLRLKANT